MSTTTYYRGVRLDRIKHGVEWTELWHVAGDFGEYPWNDALALVDTFSQEPEEPSLICCECGRRELPATWIEEVHDHLFELQMCFNCAFWFDWLEEFQQRPDKKFVVAGTAYTICHAPEKGLTTFRGFGGRNFKIRWPDGREAESGNLWCQGDVPKHWRERLPDTAEFVKVG